MKKAAILNSVLIIIIMGFFSKSESSEKIRIFDEEPHFLEYQDFPVMLFPFQKDFSAMKHVRNCKGMGLSYSLYSSSRKRCGVTWFGQEAIPYREGQMRLGFYEPYWENLKQSMEESDSKNEIVIVGLWATTRFEYGRPGETPAHYGVTDCNYDDPTHPKYWAPDRFEASIWSELRGGPIPRNGDPKDNFYTLFSYGQPIEELYSEDWPWQKKNQYYQEQLVRHIYELFADYPNWMLQLMYEIDDTGGTTIEKVVQWVNHISDFCKSFDPERLLVYCGNNTHTEILQTGKFDVISSEGTLDSVEYPEAFHDRMWRFNKPLVYKGYDPLNSQGIRMDNQDYIPDDYENDIGYEYNLQVIRNLVLHGISPSPFFHYDRWDKNNCLDNYSWILAEFIEKVETWEDEPGGEIKQDALPLPVTGVKEEYQMPIGFVLNQNYPNPFNPKTTIQYCLPTATDVKLEVYNFLGHNVRTLVDRSQIPGQYTVVWDGRSDDGLQVASGVYLSLFQAGEVRMMQKMILLK